MSVKLTCSSTRKFSICFDKKVIQFTLSSTKAFSCTDWKKWSNHAGLDINGILDLGNFSKNIWKTSVEKNPEKKNKIFSEKNFNPKYKKKLFPEKTCLQPIQFSLRTLTQNISSSSFFTLSIRIISVNKSVKFRFVPACTINLCAIVHTFHVVLSQVVHNFQSLIHTQRAMEFPKSLHS